MAINFRNPGDLGFYQPVQDLRNQTYDGYRRRTDSRNGKPDLFYKHETHPRTGGHKSFVDPARGGATVYLIQLWWKQPGGHVLLQRNYLITRKRLESDFVIEVTHGMGE